MKNWVQKKANGHVESNFDPSAESSLLEVQKLYKKAFQSKQIFTQNAPVDNLNAGLTSELEFC